MQEPLSINIQPSKKLIKEVSVILGSMKSKVQQVREKSMPDNLRHFKTATHNNHNNGRKTKRNKVESRLYQPTAASKHKSNAILMEKQKRYEKKQREVKKM